MWVTCSISEQSYKQKNYGNTGCYRRAEQGYNHLSLSYDVKHRT